MIHRFLNYEIPVWWLLLVGVLAVAAWYVLGFYLATRR